MYLAISGRSKLNHIITSPSKSNDPRYTKWTQQDATVISWINENIGSDFVNNFLGYPSGRDLWQGIQTLYSSRQDELQVYDMTIKVNDESIEVFYEKMVSLWKVIDKRVLNPMTHTEDITIYNNICKGTNFTNFLGESMTHSIKIEETSSTNYLYPLWRTRMPLPEGKFLGEKSSPENHHRS